MVKTSGIYCMKNNKNGKVYIGQTVDFRRRAYDHIVNYTRENNVHLIRAIDKYGINSFSIELLEQCQSGELNEREVYYINLYNSTDRRYGYNILGGGNQPPTFYGRRHTEQTKAIMSERAKGKQPWLGKHHTEETKKKKSELVSGELHYFFGKKREGSSSKYYGVSVHVDKRTGTRRFRAKISLNGKVIEIGTSKDEIECAKMYDMYIENSGLPNPKNFS